ncbi:SRPBCC family protein [Paracoccus benzoatiresistens]|uniref:SRPBCC family protein n=1 Tax=Paracoccus benzoatiresistens TaxID=2997341 RepID=A0ABT4JD98_9RHOB|nr:SRPBCC family protein [Paracoccus sp. EF6]MCZ0964496.1 SRPBCC family protein [Paracoccus sp. EF6]
MAYVFSKAVEAVVPAAPEDVFAVLDDPRRLGRHMERPSMMMLGGSMHYTLDEQEGRAVGSVIRVEGWVLGLPLSIIERIAERDPPRRKVWETIEEPRLLVFGNYRLGFEIATEVGGSRVRVFIDYNLPRSRLGRLLGAHAYARWCLRRMLAEASSASDEATTSQIGAQP